MKEFITTGLTSKEGLKGCFQTETKEVISNRKTYEGVNITSEGTSINLEKFNGNRLVTLVWMLKRKCLK